MPIRALDDWARPRTAILDLSTLKDTVIGIDASHYLHQHLHHHSTREPLLIALGGFPFALRANIERELQALKSLGIGCLFVFDGLQFGQKEPENQTRAEQARAFEQAWELYDRQQADQVVDAFSNAGTPKPTELYRFLQRILFENGINFMVAPYSASAQLVYLEKGTPKSFIDAIFGSSDALLFDIDRLITKIDLESSQFEWISKQTCLEEFGRLTNEAFVDFGLMLGSRFLPTFPPFETYGKGVNVRDALNMFNAAGRNALALCTQFEEDRRVQELQYLDRYKRAYMAVKHHVYTDIDGRVGPMDPDNAPSDVHELIGQRLPEELYFYLFKGVLGPKVPNYLTSGEVVVPLPLGVEDSAIYRQLAGESLMPLRTQALCLLSNCLHRFYVTKVIHPRLWFEEYPDQTINLKALPSVKETIQHWKISRDLLPESLKNAQNPGSLKFAVAALKDPDFPPGSFASKDSPSLSSQEDILSNVYWRFLQLRGYIDEKHQLTRWGNCLREALSVLDENSNLEESVMVAIELLRFGTLGTKDWFSHISGGPMRGSDEDKSFNLLISRVACIGKLKHKAIGYSGPLSRQLLSFRSLISAVRTALRDLIEVVLTSMLLSGDVNRDFDSLTEISLKLPFMDDNDCGLGIAVRTYLDDVPHEADGLSPESCAAVKAKGKAWFQHSENFPESLDTAFTLWDAVYKGSQNAGKEFKDSKLWEDTNKWLADRR